METTVFWYVTGTNFPTFKNRLQGPKRLYLTITVLNITMHKAPQNMDTQHSAHSDAVCTGGAFETS